MKMTHRWLWFVGLLTVTLAAFAQTNAPGTLPVELPQTLSQYWDLAIAAVSPLIVTGLWKLMPKLPKAVVPLLAPVVGIGLGLLLNWLAKAHLGWVDMAKAGALAVFIREVVNKAITQPYNTAAAAAEATTATKPPTP